MCIKSIRSNSEDQLGSSIQNNYIRIGWIILMLDIVSHGLIFSKSGIGEIVKAILVFEVKRR